MLGIVTENCDFQLAVIVHNFEEFYKYASQTISK